VFKDPNGEEVCGPMENSHQPNYGDRYYARLKALERQVVKEFEDPYSVMLTFSGSSRNANGEWRCPADHLRYVVESWRPKSGRGVYHALRQVLNDRRWEYAIVVEKHKSGYAHVHCAVFVDGVVEEEQFHSVIDAHIRHCDIAGKSAHDYLSPNESDRPISVKRINPNAADVDSIGNLGSYIGEYIGAYGKPLFDRGLDELIFRAAAWATGTQIVRFSTGANEMIRQDREGEKSEKEEETIESNPEFDPEMHAGPGNDVLPFEIANPGWSIVGIARGSGEDERLFDIKQGSVEWVEIEDASGLDPPIVLTPSSL
jgi:hypothetical protein